MQTSHYEQLGGDKAVRKLVDRFYALMDSRDDVQALRDIHAPNLDDARQKLYMFLSGWLGGPPLYTDKYGHPRLRQRHMPFKIGEIERDQWMSCMQQAMDEMLIDTELKQQLTAAFYKTADFMRNQ